MSRDDLVFVGHMLDTVIRARQKVAAITRAQYDADDNLRLALAHLVQTVGEAARRVSTAFADAHAGVPWRQVIAMRHKVVHDYLDVDYDIVWDVVTVEFEKLETSLRQLVAPLESGRS